jgi:hypothetical protein
MGQGDHRHNRRGDGDGQEQPNENSKHTSTVTDDVASVKPAQANGVLRLGHFVVCGSNNRAHLGARAQQPRYGDVTAATSSRIR